LLTSDFSSTVFKLVSNHTINFGVSDGEGGPSPRSIPSFFDTSAP